MLFQFETGQSLSPGRIPCKSTQSMVLAEEDRAYVLRTSGRDVRGNRAAVLSVVEQLAKEPVFAGSIPLLTGKRESAFAHPNGLAYADGLFYLANFGNSTRNDILVFDRSGALVQRVPRAGALGEGLLKGGSLASITHVADRRFLVGSRAYEGTADRDYYLVAIGPDGMELLQTLRLRDCVPPEAAANDIFYDADAGFLYVPSVDKQGYRNRIMRYDLSKRSLPRMSPEGEPLRQEREPVVLSGELFLTDEPAEGETRFEIEAVAIREGCVYAAVEREAKRQHGKESDGIARLRIW